MISRRQLYFRMLSRSVLRRRGKLALALAALIAGSSAAAALLSLSSDISRKMNSTLRSYGANLLVTPRAQGQFLPPEIVTRIAQVTDASSIAGLSPAVFISGRANSYPAIITAVDFSRTRSVSPYWNVRGSWPTAGSTDECLVGLRLARQLKVQAGDFIRVNSADSEDRSLRIAGLASTGDAEDEQVFISMAAAATIAPGIRGISLVSASVLGGFGEVERVAGQINEAVTEAEAKPLRQIAVSEGALLGKIRLMMALLTAGILVASGLCVMSTMTALVVERTKEIGLHKALGATSKSVLALVLGEALGIGILGGLLGFALGMSYVQLVAMRMFETFIQPHASVLVVVLAISSVVALLGSLLPMKRALLVRPAIVLKGE